MDKPFWVLRWTVVLTIFGEIISIYVPNEIDQTPKPYTTGIKIKTSHFKTLTEPYYHSNYSKVYIHNKNYTSSLLDSANADSQRRTGQLLNVHPVYISEEKKKKIKDILIEHNTNVVDKDTLNNKVVYKRRIEKSKNIEVYNKCPKGLTGQFVYDSSCNQYLDCWNGRGGPRNCAPGTLFNPKSLECDFPDKVECLTGPSANSVNTQRSAKLQVYEQAKCPEGFSGLIPNYTDCSKFIQCNSGIQNPGTCPPGTLFDIRLNVCNHPGETTCFTGQSGTVYAVKEEIGGSTDQAGQYYGQTSQSHSQTGQYQRPQSGQYQSQSGQNFDVNGRYTGQQVSNGHQYQNGQFYGQSNYLGQNQQNQGCDPTSPYCNNGGYVISGQNIHGYPQVLREGSTSAVGSNSLGQDIQYYGGSTQTSNCNPQMQNCQPSQTGLKTGTVYIQFVMCNPIEDDCSSFQQGTFMLGPGGTLCNPLKQACKSSESSYVPSNKMQEPTGSNGASLAGTYYVKYITCNPQREDCSKYQQGIMEATYGVPGTLIGVRPVQDPDCDSKIYNCDTVQYQGENRPTIPTYDQIFGGHGQTSTPCNPMYQNCDGQGSLQGSKGRFPKKYNNTTNYKKVCSSGNEGCYQGRPKTKTDSTNQNSAVEPICPDGFQGITKHPTDCKKFLNCANGITYIQDCSPGTLFNPFIKTCDFAYNVDCKDNDETSTTYYDSDNKKPDYDQIQVRVTPRPQYGDNQSKNPSYNQYPVHTNGCQGTQCGQNKIGPVQGHYPGQNTGGNQQGSCQGTHCTQNPEYALQGQYEPGQGQNLDNSYVQIHNKAPINGCQGSQCGQGQFSQDQLPYEGQNVGGYQPIGCQGSQCVYGAQGQPSRVHAQPQDYYGQQPTQRGCQGSDCDYIPQSQHQGQYQPQVLESSSIYPEKICKGNRCQKACQGRECGTNQSPDLPGQHSVNDPGQIEDYGDQIGPYQTTTQRTNFPPTQSHRRPTQGQPENEGHIMKIPGQKGQQGVTPINKFDRVTYGGFNNQKSIDYVDVFNPDESRNIAYATTTRKPSAKQVWPPPYPDLATSDPNADYVFEYEDGEPVTLAPEKVNLQKRKKTRCEDNDFFCDKRSCVAKNFVCDGVRDCDDGKDEKYCKNYLEQYKVYTNSRLDVLEKQRWDNVSYSTCALLCMDSKKFECKSFNYRKIDKTCFLTNENIGTSGALKSYYPCDYYERTATSMDCSDMHKCPSEKCLTSDQVCDGYDDCGDRADEKGCRAEDFGYQVKLAGGQSENEGRVEVTVFGKTGYICDDQFSLTDADVLCKELGFHLGAAEVKGNSFYAKDIKENHTLYMMDDIECFGNETSIMHCNFAGWGIHNCADHEIAGIVCRTPQESCSEGFWKCDTGNECVKLPFLCDDLDDCTDNSDEASHHCNTPTELRLVNGTSNNEGRLEIRHHGVWGSICDDDFNEDAAKIVCRYLGYPGGAYVKKEAFFGESSGPIWLDQVSCFGNETSLEKCAHWDWGDNNCDHSEDVGLVCSRDMIEVEAQRSSKAFGGEISGSIKDLGTSNSSPEPVSCGYRKDNIFLESDDVHFRVVQGSIARPGDYPWQAALRIKGQEKSAHWCGAVVVASKWVLTAAHCLEGYPKGSYVVVAGEYNIDEDEGTEQQAFIEEYYLHEHFREGHKMGNDIALIKLKGNGFKLNQDIQPICLPDETSDYERELNCTISGFGTVQTGKSAYSHKLRAAWIPVQKMDVCKMAHIYGEAITEGMICAGDLTGGGDACDGDSGGPLACLEDGVFTLYGLTSWGQRCGYANKPGVYVKVAHYKKWINNIMKTHS